MNTTAHQVLYTPAQDMSAISDHTVDLVVTSPPYPMIEMWDEIMMKQNAGIAKAFDKKDFQAGYELMHVELDKVWAECYRVMKEGGIACINIGDATRTLDKNFVLYPNHARIIQAFIKLGFQNLPNIIWRKQTNAPNKFMGSGMYPPGAYVTLEHEYILVFRKGRKREFKKEEQKIERRKSSYFWEERNNWFSDVWDIKGTKQKLVDKSARERSAAYPFDIPYRLINMFSVQCDTVLDPFLGTGTTTLAAMTAMRNSIGVEIDEQLADSIADAILNKEEALNQVITSRLAAHRAFVEKRLELKGPDAFKHKSEHYGFPVITKQEALLQFSILKEVVKTEGGFKAIYSKD